MITDEAGEVAERNSFDAWGKRRETSWQDASYDIIPQETSRGFTGHEHLDEVGLIHMNGRVYDPTLGRFLSADPFVQQADATQNYNRYTYVNNNPLSYTDPSGFFFGKIFKAIGKIFKAKLRIKKAVLNYINSVPGLRLVVTAVVAYFCGPAAAACVAGLNAAFTLASGGSLLQAAIVAAVSYATYSISIASSEAASASATQTGLADGIVATTADASAQATTQTATEGIRKAASSAISAANIVEKAMMGNSKAENASNTSAAKKTVTASSGMNNARLKRSGGNKRNEIYSHRGGNLADNMRDLSDHLTVDNVAQAIDYATMPTDVVAIAASGGFATPAIGFKKWIKNYIVKWFGKKRRWKFGNNKNIDKFRRQMEQRGWTDKQIDESIQKGTKHNAPNKVNPDNTATRYLHPETGRSVVIDDKTKEVIHVGGDGFKY